jgi:hypothetical protein
MADPIFTPQDWDRLVAEHLPPNVLLVAVDETDGLIGYTAAHPTDGEMFLLFVHPAHAGRGIGRTLLAAAHDALRAAGCREAFLFTHEQNERALAVYTAAGYRPDGSVRVSDFRGTHHVPGDDEQENQDQPHAPRPTPELADGFANLARRGRMPRADRGPALEDGTNQEGGAEKSQRQPDPGLTEIPGVAVDDHPEPKANDGDHRRSEDQGTDHTESADETGDG